jgi:dipeptidyl aminopeptidase/acylaminoacyl peptidase
VPAAFSESLAERIENIGGEAALFVYPGDDHDITRYFSAAMNETVAFYDEHLK